MPSVLALLAAAVSIVAALFAFRAQRRAERSAGDVLRVNHRIVAHDREMAQFRGDYAAVLDALDATLGETPHGLRVVSASEILTANSLTTPTLADALDQLNQAVAVKDEAAIPAPLSVCRAEYRKIMAVASQRRTKLVEVH